MLITHNGRCLLGHEHRFPEKMYSTLAGYVEAGDDIENAVRREIKEEADIDVGEVRYVASQPWPFPHSLMIGCWGEALTATISLDRTGSRTRAGSLMRRPAMLALAHLTSLCRRRLTAHTLIRGFVDGALDRQF